MKLGIVWAHDRAIVANKLFARVAKVAQRLVVKETLLLEDRIHLIGTWMWIASTKHGSEWVL